MLWTRGCHVIKAGIPSGSGKGFSHRWRSDFSILRRQHRRRILEGEGTCIRNALLVRWFYELGLRRGEVLNVKIPDINFQSEELTVVRRADDPEDPRKDQPLVKTRDRKIPLSPAFAN